MTVDDRDGKLGVMSVFTNPSDRAGEGASAYVDAVLELLADRDPMSVLTTTCVRIAELVADVGDAELREAEAPGKWSMIEIVQHVADTELVWAYRLRMALAEERPVIAGYDQDRWARALRYREARLGHARSQLELLRAGNLGLLAPLDDDDRARAVRHAERGDESVGMMIRLYAGHDLVHLRQLARVRAHVT